MSVPRPQPVFIVGAPRSGTSVFTWSLGQHPNLLPLEETNWLAEAAVGLGSAHAIGSLRGELSHLSAAGVELPPFMEECGKTFDAICRERPKDPPGARSAAFARIRSAADPKERWVDGTPENSLNIYGLCLLFPAARFIHLVRNLDDVVRSLANFSATGAADVPVNKAYKKWLSCVSACEVAERALGPEQVLRVRYEDLVAQPEATLQRTLRFLGEEFSPDCLLPLQERINSSRVAKDFTVSLSDVDEDVLALARELDARMKADRPTGTPDEEAVALLRAPFEQRVTSHLRSLNLLA